jgi:hypothetical protein
VIPPLTAVAVKVAVAPWQTGLAWAAMAMETGRLLLTVIVTWLDRAVTPKSQDEFEVILQVTISLLRGMYEKVEELEPASVPLTFH